MITALIQFKLPKPVTRAQAQEIFLRTAPKYRGIPRANSKILPFVIRRRDRSRPLLVEIPGGGGTALYRGMEEIHF